MPSYFARTPHRKAVRWKATPALARLMGMPAKRKTEEHNAQVELFKEHHGRFFNRFASEIPFRSARRCVFRLLGYSAARRSGSAAGHQGCAFDLHSSPGIIRRRPATSKLKTSPSKKIRGKRLTTHLRGATRRPCRNPWPGLEFRDDAYRKRRCL